MKINKFENTIINGDALDILLQIPSGSVDLGVTSPPYNKGENKKGWLVKNVKYSDASDKHKEADYQENQIKVLNELWRVIKPGGSFFYNHKIRWEKGELLHPVTWLAKTKWALRQEIIWDRMIAANIRGWRFWQVEERIYWLYKPENNNLIGKELKSKYALLTSIWRFSPERKNPHPAPFPIALPVRIISALLENCKGIVIDPFCGSGTTLAAANLLGHSYIGIDKSKEYVAMSNKRVADTQKDSIAVDEEVAKHIVVKTFADRKRNKEFTGKFNPNRNVDVSKEELYLFR